MSVYGAVFCADEVWMVMDLFSEGNLHARLHSTALPLSPRERLSLAANIAGAVDYMHKQGCVLSAEVVHFF